MFVSSIKNKTKQNTTPTYRVLALILHLKPTLDLVQLLTQGCALQTSFNCFESAILQEEESIGKHEAALLQNF